MLRYARNDRGVVLLTVLILLLTVSLLGAALIEMVTVVDISTRGIEEETQALYLAEAGLAHGIHMLHGRAAGVGGNIMPAQVEETVGPVPLGEGHFTVLFSFDESLMTSTGDLRGTKKTVQLQYQAF